MKKIVITGGSGKLGKSLKKFFNEALFPSHHELDITDNKSVASYFKKHQADIIIHTAAITHVRQCDANRNFAWNVNVQGTVNLLKILQKQKNNPYFILISTPCIFDGKSSPFNEESIPDPKNFYGLTKLAQEVALQSSGLKNWLIVRTNFIPEVPWPYPKAFKDRFGTYLFSDDVAKIMKDVVEKGTTGIVHIVGDRKISMYQLAKMVTPKIKPMTFKDYRGPELTVDMSLTSRRWRKYRIGFAKNAI